MKNKILPLFLFTVSIFIAGCSTPKFQQPTERIWTDDTIDRERISSIKLGEEEVHVVKAVLPAGVFGDGTRTDKDRLFYGLERSSGMELQPTIFKHVVAEPDRILIWKQHNVQRYVPAPEIAGGIRRVRGLAKQEDIKLVDGVSGTGEVSRILVFETMDYLFGTDGKGYDSGVDRFSIYDGSGDLINRYKKESGSTFSIHEVDDQYHIQSGSYRAYRGWEDGNSKLTILNAEGDEVAHYSRYRWIELEGRQGRKVVGSLDDPELFWVYNPDTQQYAPPAGSLGVIPPPMRMGKSMHYEVPVQAGRYEYPNRKFEPAHFNQWLVAFATADGGKQYALANHDLSEIGKPVYSDWNVLPSQELKRIKGTRDRRKADNKYPSSWLALKQAGADKWVLKSPYPDIIGNVYGDAQLDTSLAMAESKWKTINDHEQRLAGLNRVEKRKEYEIAYEKALAENDYRNIYKYALYLNISLVPQIEQNVLTDEELVELAGLLSSDEDTLMARKIVERRGLGGKPEPIIAPEPAQTVVVEECQNCEGKGFLVSMRAIETRFAPTHITRNGITYSSRTSITTQQKHYDGVCGICKGSGVIER